MTLDEKRLFIMATPLARTTNISSGEPIYISTEEFASACGIEITGAYTALGIATKKLFDRYFGYTRADKAKVNVRWVYKPYMVKVVQSYILPMRYFCFCVSLMPLTHIPNIKRKSYYGSKRTIH